MFNDRDSIGKQPWWRILLYQADLLILYMWRRLREKVLTRRKGD